MNFGFHIFGNPRDIFSQYPSDESRVEIQADARRQFNRMLCIRREGSIVTYTFYNRLSPTSYIGFRLTLNGMEFSRPKALCNLLARVVDTAIVEGHTLRFDRSGTVTYATSFRTMSDLTHFADGIHRYLAYQFDTYPDRYGCCRLRGMPDNDTPYFAKDTDSELDINDKTYSHKVVYLNDDKSNNCGHIASQISNLAERIDEANANIDSLKEENARLNRQKKQFKIVILLMLLLCGTGFWLWSINSDLTDTRLSLDSAYEQIHGDSIRIDYLINQRDSLTSANHVLKQNLDSKSLQLQRISSAVSNLHEYSYLPNWSSNNHSDNSVSSHTYQFYGYSGDELSFDYYVDSEGPDYFKYYLSGPTSRNGSYSGQSRRGTIKCPLETGYYTLTVKYTKDGSIRKFSDRASVSAINIRRGDVTSCNSAKPETECVAN